MELATALHHSARGPKKRVVEEPREEELPVKHNATSGQNATPPWGVRPAHPLDVSAQPPLVAATCVAAGAPLLAVPSLGGGDAIDDTSVQFLLEMALLSPAEVEQQRRAERRKLAREREEKKREEKKREQDKYLDELAKACQDLFSIKVSASASSSGGVTKRKRKKRRKRKTPKTSSSARVGVQIQRCGHGSALALHDVAGIMVGMDVKDSYALIVGSGGGRHVQGSFCWFFASLCVPFGCRQARGQVGMDQTHNCAVGWFYW